MRNCAFSTILFLSLAICCLGQQPAEAPRLGAILSDLPRPQETLVVSNAAVGSLEQIQRYPVPDTLTLGTYQTLFHTDNAFWTKSDRQASLGWAGSFWATWTPYSTRRWRPQIGVEQDMYRHDKASAADYDTSIAFASSRLYLDANQHWSWDLNYSLWRYQGYHPAEDYLKYGWLRNGFTWTHPLARQPRLYLLGTYQVGWQHSSPSQYDRIENTLLLSLVWYPANTICVQPFVFCEGFIYTRDTTTQVNRRDFRLSPGISLTWEPFQYIALGGGLLWLGNYSNNPDHDYQVLTPALSVQASIGF